MCAPYLSAHRTLVLEPSSSIQIAKPGLFQAIDRRRCGVNSCQVFYALVELDGRCCDLGVAELLGD